MAKRCEVGADVLGRLIIAYRKKGTPHGLRSDSDDHTNSIDFPTEKVKQNWLNDGKHTEFVQMYARARKHQQEHRT